ncbi:MAG TPA: GNAT family N-acetyltransferase [Arenimonas sp.]|nr:GNAT family N-acetyltransferase [Arenimonas sp.]HOZ04005.1 GNAT family N-acetyltransferase [Arenimonas sp.]HPO24233.1 GNAT family N-acetyltransferase [Arenimonas sp.]HPW31892.1 GNAT family N-acetyltransferase [Arenimonas sp.]
METAEIRISTNRADVNLDVVHAFLSQDAYWSKNIPFELVRKAIENSYCFSAFVEDRQVGFARVISDGATFAYLCDVFTLPEFRGCGIGKKLMQTVQAHPELQGLRRWMLMTADAHKLYESYGFSVLAKPDRAMEISKPDIYL